MISLLRFAGKNGAWVVIAGVVLGFCIPALSEWARSYLALAIFAFTLGSFLKFDLASFRNELIQMKRNVLIVLWSSFGIPLVVWAVVMLFKPGPDLTQGLIFWALVPASGACVAFAAVVGLKTPLALLVTVVATAASPFYIPPLAVALAGQHLSADPAQLCARLLAIVGGAFVASMLVRRFASGVLIENPDAMTGVAVVALFVAGMGSMRGLLGVFLADPRLTLELLALSYAVVLGFQWLGTLLFWQSGRSAALTAGLVSGARTITMAWVVLGDDILPLANVFFGCAMIAKYTTPAITKWIVARLMSRASDEASDAESTRSVGYQV